MKKITSVFLALLLVLSMAALTACSGSSDKTSADASGNSSDVSGSSQSADVSDNAVAGDSAVSGSADSNGTAAGDTDASTAADTGSTAAASGSTAAAENTATVSTLTVQSVSGQAGSQVVVPITLNGMDGLTQYGNGTMAGIQFNVKFDSSAMTPVDAQAGNEELSNGVSWYVSGNTTSDGVYMIMGTDANWGGVNTSGDMTVANVYFNLADGASGTYTVELEMIDACDTEANSTMNSYIGVQSGTITVN